MVAGLGSREKGRAAKHGLGHGGFETWGWLGSRGRELPAQA